MKVVVQSAAQQTWTLYLAIPGLPESAIKVGDTFDLAIKGVTEFFQGNAQTITLARNGKLAVFGYSDHWVPASIFDIMTSDAGTTCSVNTCGFEHHTLNVAYGADTAVVHEGETTQVGNLSFSLGHDIVWVSGPGQGCDASSFVFMGGFVVSP